MSATTNERLAKIEAENDRLHERLGYWRERAGEMAETLKAVLEIEEASEIPRWSNTLLDEVRALSGVKDERARAAGEPEKWLGSRPPNVRRMANKFPPGTKVMYEATECFVVGYVEEEDGDVGLRLSAYNPNQEYDLAMENFIVVFPIVMDLED